MGSMSAWPTGGSLWESNVGRGVAELVLRHCQEGGHEGRGHGAEGKGAWGQPGGWWIVKAEGGRTREGKGRD